MKLKPAFFDGIRDLIAGARTTVARGVDLVQVHTNFEIGRRIVEEEQRGKDRAAYGKEVIKALADRLTAEFGKGFSTSNLAYMRTFYLLYEDRSLIFQTPSGKSGPSRIGQSATDEFNAPPIGQTLSDQFDASPKSQTASGQLPIFQTLSGKSGPTPRPFALSWSHYVFLLGIEDHNERSFYEIEAGAQNWTVRELRRQFDSGLYERLALSRDKEGIRKLAREGQTVAQASDLRDLKLGKVAHQDLGQMQMYVNYFDRFVKTGEENPTIGIVLCKRKNKALVEITLPKDANIHAREYQLYLPSKDELQQKLMEWIGERGASDE